MKRGLVLLRRSVLRQPFFPLRNRSFDTPNVGVFSVTRTYGTIRRNPSIKGEAPDFQKMLEGISKEDISCFNALNSVTLESQGVSQKVLETLSETSIDFQQKVFELISKKTDSLLLVNIKLQNLLLNRDPSSTLHYILENIQRPLNHDLLEVFVSQNLHKTNLAPMTLLLQVIFLNHPDFVLSNELWSLYVSCVCEEFSLLGAKLVYHHLIDNYKLFNEDYSAYNNTQTVFPFLLSPTVISTLSSIFQREALPDYIIGLRNYFKRFYSLYGHRDSFKSISISLVEAYSESNDVAKALSTFKYLCMFFRGHQNFQPIDNALEAVYSMMNDNNRWRISNLQSNKVKYPEWPNDLKSEIDLLQQKFADENGLGLFNPIDAKGNTTRVVPIIPGSLQLNDLVLFNILMDKVVEKHMTSDASNKIHIIIRLIESNHFMLSSFIASSLANKGYIFEAFAIIKKTQPKYHDLILPALFKEDLFVALFEQCKSRLQTLSSNEISNFQALLDLYQLIGDLMKFYCKAYKSAEPTIASPKVMAAYISLVLNTPRFQSSLIESYLNQYVSRCNQKIYLSPEDFEKLNELYDLQSSRYSGVISSRP